MLDHWPGTLVVVSHDTALLELMDTTAELREGELVGRMHSLEDMTRFIEVAHVRLRLVEELVRDCEREPGVAAQIGSRPR